MSQQVILENLSSGHYDPNTDPKTWISQMNENQNQGVIPKWKYEYTDLQCNGQSILGFSTISEGIQMCGGNSETVLAATYADGGAGSTMFYPMAKL
ncbi:hypothetical protein LPJ61_005110 [Coemansia biformis]|uniref:Uncharacterized protein n=1 Tax=Coemansia biformis TaxID=1286918 RepID=A0A9W7Y9F2_9FUNG|nr:hypothetical protein LPJ61_005110 [Coemansia biformis]